MRQLTGREAFGERLRRERRKLAEREDRDIENQDIAKALGVDAATIGRWFLGKSMPRDDRTMAQLAAYFGVTPGWLHYGQEPREAPVDTRPVKNVDPALARPVPKREATPQRKAK